MSTKTTLSLQLSHTDLLALEAVAGYNTDRLADVVTGMVKTQLTQLQHSGTVLSFHSADHLDNIPAVSGRAVGAGMMLAMGFIDMAVAGAGGQLTSAVMPVLFRLIGKIDNDYLVAMTEIRPNAFRRHIVNGRETLFTEEQLKGCTPVFTAVRGQLGEGQLAVYPQVGPHNYMQHDLSQSPVYRVPATAIYGVPDVVRQELESFGGAQAHAGAQYTGERPGGSHGSWNTNNGGMFNGRGW